MLAVKILEKLQTSGKDKEQISSKIIGEKVCEQGSKGIKLVTGKPLQVLVNTCKYKPKQITLVDMIRIQARLTLSNSKLIQLPKELKHICLNLSIYDFNSSPLNV